MVDIKWYKDESLIKKDCVPRRKYVKNKCPSSSKMMVLVWVNLCM